MFYNPDLDYDVTTYTLADGRRVVHHDNPYLLLVSVYAPDGTLLEQDEPGDWVERDQHLGVTLDGQRFEGPIVAVERRNAGDL